MFHLESTDYVNYMHVLRQAPLWQCTHRWQLKIAFMQLLKQAKLDDMETALKDHFCSKVLACASRLQSSGQGTPNQASLCYYNADQFGEELAQCLQGLTPAKVIPIN